MATVMEIPTTAAHEAITAETTHINKSQSEGRETSSTKDLVNVFKLLSSTPRLHILMYLVQDGELNVTDLCERLKQTQPAVSHHLALMRLHGLIQLRRDGKHSIYSVNLHRIQDVMDRFQVDILGRTLEKPGQLGSY